MLALHNDYRYGLINGQRGTITSSELDGFLVHFDSEQQPRLVPGAYFDAGHVDHAYAMTVHRAQGLTSDRAFVLGTDDLYAEAGYTALSRGRHENRLYLTTQKEPDVDHHGVPEEDDPIAGIHTALQRTEHQELASQLLRGVATARIVLPATLDRRGGHTISADQPEHDDAIDLGW